METSSATSAAINNNEPQSMKGNEEMQIDSVPASSSSPSPPPRVPSPMITVCDVSDQQPTPSGAPQVPATNSRDVKKSPTGAVPRQRKRSQPVRGDLLPDPDKLLSYKHHDKHEEEALEDPTFPGGHPKPPPEPRQPGQPAVRKRSNVTFCAVVETIEK